MNALFVLALLFGWVGLAQAADPEAGKQKAAACTACHGANGISVAPDIANLAGQKDAYLKAQLQAFRGGTRKNPLMNAMAAQLSDTDIANLAAFFASLPPGRAQERDEVALLGVAQSHTEDQVEELHDVLERQETAIMEAAGDRGRLPVF